MGFSNWGLGIGYLENVQNFAEKKTRQEAGAVAGTKILNGTVFTKTRW